MRQISKQCLWKVAVVFENGMTKIVPVKAATLEAAERRALKRHPSAVGVDRSR